MREPKGDQTAWRTRKIKDFNESSGSARKSCEENPRNNKKIFKRDRNITSSMASLKKCHTQNAFTIEMSIMFYDIAAKGPRKTNQVKGKTRPAKYFHLPDKS